MTTEKTHELQVKSGYVGGSDDVKSVLAAVDAVAGKINHDGLSIPPVFALGECGPVIMLEDRDAVVKSSRGRRFDVDSVIEALGHAHSVTIVPYARRVRGARLGLTRSDEHALTLLSRLQAGGAIIVQTTSDRLRVWLELARRNCRRGATIEYFDAVGVTRVVEGGL